MSFIPQEVIKIAHFLMSQVALTFFPRASRFNRLQTLDKFEMGSFCEGINCEGDIFETGVI